MNIPMVHAGHRVRLAEKAIEEIGGITALRTPSIFGNQFGLPNNLPRTVTEVVKGGNYVKFRYQETELYWPVWFVEIVG